MQLQTPQNLTRNRPKMRPQTKAPKKVPIFSFRRPKQEKVSPKGEKGVPRGVRVSPENRLKSTLLPNWGNRVSKMVPGGSKMVPCVRTNYENASNIFSKSMHNGPTLVLDRFPHPGFQTHSEERLHPHLHLLRH